MRSMCGALAALVITLGLAAPADAKMVYRWETDEGVVSFADELKRVPERYRGRVARINTETLESTKRFSRSGEPAQASHRDDVRARLAALRQMNREVHGIDGAIIASPRTISVPLASTGRHPVREIPGLTTQQARDAIAAGTLNPSGIRFRPGAADGDPVYRRRSGFRTPAVQPNLQISPDPNSDEPVVVERKRVRTAGSVTTQTITIVRQGDRILSVIKPQPNVHRSQAWEEDPY